MYFQSGHWRFGPCISDQATCESQKYNLGNVTEIAGIELANMNEDNFDTLLLAELAFPSDADSMNCEQMCKCVTCAGGSCVIIGDTNRCPNNEAQHICQCNYSDRFTTFHEVVVDMVITDNACRECTN